VSVTGQVAVSVKILADFLCEEKCGFIHNSNSCLIICRARIQGNISLLLNAMFFITKNRFSSQEYREGGG
jgi:hypothetical protein